tara:strand:- start:3399 stop:4538 length:1140 start_codon:yes stop_codon:yes gene_type:complete
MSEIAKHLSAAGDQTILFSGPLHIDDPGDDPALVETRIETHDWSKPLYISGPLVRTPIRRAAREGKIVPPFRQVIIGATYLFWGGIFCDWRAGSSAFLTPVAKAFCPDLVYGTFGNTDAWYVARSLAVTAKCPWVADYKDPWNKFIPIGLRHNVASRFTDLAAMTVFSKAHGRDASAWFPGKKYVVYSGYRAEPNTKKSTKKNDIFRVCLSGSVYDGDKVRLLLEGMIRTSLSQKIVLFYAGNDGGVVDKIVEQENFPVEFENLGYLDIAALVQLQASATVNVYIRNEESLFQQKVIELLALGRPVMAIPGESAEASDIARKIGGELIGAKTPGEIAGALAVIGDDRTEIDQGRLQPYSWSCQTKKLRQIFSDVMDGWV